MGESRSDEPVVGMASTTDGHGYWLVASDGGVFTFGDAPFDGSLAGTHLNGQIVGMSLSGATTGSVLAAGLPSFYSVPTQLPSGPPGTLIKAEQIAAPGIDGTVYRVMYLSETELGRPVAVTGLVMVPDGSGSGRRVPGGHVGPRDQRHGLRSAPRRSSRPRRSPSRTSSSIRAGRSPPATTRVRARPGIMPYLAGVSAARNMIDIVRAARQLPAAHASANYMVWGHSEGGQTAMFGLNIAASYAPELHLEGVVAGAPPSQFEAIYAFLTGARSSYYLFMAGAGFNVAYGNAIAPLSEVITPKGLSLLPSVGQGCSDFLAQQLNTYPLATIVPKDPFTVPAWKPLLAGQRSGELHHPSTAPLLIIQGGADEQIPVVTTQLLEQHECSIGQDVERWIYPGQSHAGVIPVSMTDMVTWMRRSVRRWAQPRPLCPHRYLRAPTGRRPPPNAPREVSPAGCGSSASAVGLLGPRRRRRTWKGTGQSDALAGRLRRNHPSEGIAVSTRPIGALQKNSS